MDFIKIYTAVTARVSEYNINGTPAKLGYIVPFTLVHAGKYKQKTN